MQTLNRNMLLLKFPQTRVRTFSILALIACATSFVSTSAFAVTAVKSKTASAGSSSAESAKTDNKADAKTSRAKAKRKIIFSGAASGASDSSSNNVNTLSGTISKIRIEGNRKIEEDAVSVRLLSKVGEGLDSDKIRQDIDAIFKSGFFYDVQVLTEGNGASTVLIYKVVEKPSIVEINYSGNSEIEEDELKEASPVKAYEILNMAKIREATEKMQKLYEDKGYFLAKVTPRIEPVKKDETVKLTFEVEENEKVKVKRITFLGNRNLPDGKLKEMMATKEGGFFSFMSGAGAYKQDNFDRDVQVIQYLYFNEGYLQVKVDRPQVYVSPDKKGIYITIRVEEGERFKVGQVDFAGDLLFERDDLFESVLIDGSGWYVHETLLGDLRTLQAKYGDLGYAYANIIPRTKIREKDREVDITFEIDKGNKVYFHRIMVTGNSKTRDKVLRRELLIREGELYNETRKRESLDNIKRLGFFEEVNFNSSTPTEGADLMNIDIVVKERNTGTIQVGAGYSSYQQFILNGQVSQINLMGKGQKLGVSVDISKQQKTFNLNFTEPYFMDTKWSVGTEAFYSYVEKRPYTEEKIGSALTLGHPLAPYLMGFVRYKLDKTKITLTDDPNYYDPDLYPVETANGITSSVRTSIEYDKRNDRFAPSKGIFGSLALEYAGVGGDKRYTKGLANFRFYEKVFWDVVFRNNISYGIIAANAEANGGGPPFNELFLLGGANTLRGFDWFTIGKKKYSKRSYENARTALLAGRAPGSDPTAEEQEKLNRNALQPFGGTQQLYWNSEFEFPLISEAKIKGVLFYDVGTADDDIVLENVRSNVGFGFRWFSPIGPLRFEWGFPLARVDEDGERAVNFQFAIGSPF